MKDSILTLQQACKAVDNRLPTILNNLVATIKENNESTVYYKSV